MNTLKNHQEGEENHHKRKHEDISCSQDEEIQKNDENQTFEKSLKASKKETNSLKKGEPKVTVDLSKPNSTHSPSENPITLLDENNSLESFTSKIENKMPIVDKTGSLYHLIRLPGAYLAVTPKKSGKTFHITTLEAISQEGKEWWETNCSHLDIVKNYHYDFPKLAVLKLDFNGVLGSEQLKLRVRKCLETLAQEYHLEEKFTYYFKPEKDKMCNDELLNLFEEVIQEVAETTGKGLVLLIDEYDQPIIRKAETLLKESEDLHTVKMNPEIREMARFVEILLIAVKALRVKGIRGKDDCLIKFVYVTGTVSICQGGMFWGSDFLDLRIFQKQEFADLFGENEEDAARLSLRVPQQNDPSIFESL